MSDDQRLLALVRALAAELKPGVGDFSAFGLNHGLERDFGLDSLARVELHARIERVLADLVERCCATNGNVRCPLIAALQDA